MITYQKLVNAKLRLGQTNCMAGIQNISETLGGNKMLNKHYEGVEIHRRLVWQVGNVLGVDTQQLLEHDLSKYSVEEFEPYAQWFYGNREQPNAKENFDIAWQRHIRYNLHHWEYWIFQSNNNQAVPMPNKYILEMVTDWQAAKIQNQGHQTMSKWLNTNFDKMVLHKETREKVITVLGGMLGYDHYLSNDLNSEGKFDNEFIFNYYHKNLTALRIEEIVAQHLNIKRR